MATYQPLKPLSTDQLSTSQGYIKNNYTAIKALIDVNHGTFTGGVSPEGKHIKVDIVNSATHPAVTAGDLLIYNYVNATTTLQELYVKRHGALATAGIPFTARAGTGTGWTYLPSGLLVKWGNVNTPVDVNLNASDPNFSAVYFAMATPTNTTHGTAAALIVGTTLRVRTATAPMLTYWMAVGLPD